MKCEIQEVSCVCVREEGHSGPHECESVCGRQWGYDPVDDLDLASEPLERIATALEQTNVILEAIQLTLADLAKTQKRASGLSPWLAGWPSRRSQEALRPLGEGPGKARASSEASQPLFP
jgi:hypothetical protein